MIDFTAALHSEDAYFGALSDQGQFYFYHYTLVDSKTRYLKYLKDKRKKNNETETDQDLLDARLFEGIKLIITHSEEFNLKEMF